MRRALIALFFALALAGPGAAQAPAPFVVNAILSLTGSAAFLGQGEARTLKAVESSVNKSGGVRGRPIRFEIADDQSSPQVAVQLFNQIRAANVPAILGPSLTGTCNAVAPLLNDSTVAYCLSPGVRPKPGSYMFSAGFLVRDGMIVALRYLRGKHLEHVAFISSTDATGQDGEESFRQALALPENAAVQFVDNEHFNPADISVTAQLSRIKQSGADAVIALTTGTQLGTVLRGAADVGLRVPIFTSNGNMTIAQMKQYGTFFDLTDLYFEGTLMFARDVLPRGSVRATVEQFYRAADADQLPAEIGTSLAWDPALLLVAAFRQLGADVTGPKLRTYLSALRNFPGANGPYDFLASPQRGLTDADGVVVRWDAGKGTWVPLSLPGGSLPRR